MILSDYDNQNYAYVVSNNDELKLPYFVGDTMQEVADFLGLDLSSVCRFVNRTNEHLKRLIERVKIYDYAYIIYEKTIEEPLFIARTPHKLAKISGFSIHTIDLTLHNRKKVSRLGKKLPPYRLGGKYQVKKVDLLDLDFNLANYLYACLDAGKVLAREDEIEGVYKNG